MSKFHCGHYFVWVPMHIAFVLFMIFFSIKVSGGFTHFSWAKVFSPFWVMEFFLIFFIILTELLNDNSWDVINTLVWGFLFNISLTVWTILLAIKLQAHWLGETSSLSWMTTMIPLWIVLALINMFRHDIRKYNLQQRSGFKYWKKELQVHLPNGLITILVYSILEVINLQYTPISWTIRCIPFFYFIFSTLSTGLTLIFLKKWGPGEMVPFFLSCFLILLILAGYDLIRVGAVVLIPLYILEIYIFIGGFYVIDEM